MCASVCLPLYSMTGVGLHCAGTVALGTSLLCFLAAFSHVSGNPVELCSLHMGLKSRLGS